jgi:mannose-6-phosphate isomerase-like protein (cupin superfamily)
MAGIEIKSFDAPDETRPFEGNGYAAMVTVGGKTLGMGVFEPGWRWSDNVKPIAQTDSCEFNHVLYVISGRMGVRMNDGTEAEVGPGDVASVPAGHDAWVIGDEPCITVDMGDEDADYAKRT